MHLSGYFNQLKDGYSIGIKMGVDVIDKHDAKIIQEDDLCINGTDELNLNGIIYFCRQVFTYERRTFHPLYHGDVLAMMRELCERKISHKIEFNQRRQKYIATIEAGGAKSSCTHENPLYAICIAVAKMVRAATDEEPTA